MISDCFADPNHYYNLVNNETPERRLLLAILFRACLDLEQHSAPLDRKSAIKWFRAEIEYCEYGFTFKQVIEEFKFAEWCLKTVKAKVRAAEIYEEERVKEAIDKGEQIASFHPIKKCEHPLYSMPFRVQGRKEARAA